MIKITDMAKMDDKSKFVVTCDTLEDVKEFLHAQKLEWLPDLPRVWHDEVILK